MRKLPPLITVLLFYCITACNNSPTATVQTTGAADTAIVDGHPSWIEQGNIYEVNIRQYTPEGTFRAFEQHLDRLQDMGVQTLWFMPIQPIGKEGRKGALGSYYAVSNYKDVNPEFGTLEDWKSLVQKVHDKGMKVIIDWVPNHTAPDHPWVTTHPEYFFRDSITGKPIHQRGTDWTDTRKLDFKNEQMADSMIAAMKFWVRETGIDGYRCDHAQGPGRNFWIKCNRELKTVKKNLLLLAEAEDEWVYQTGFDMSYAWKVFHATVDIASGKRSAKYIDTILHEQDSVFTPSALFLYFTSNHDENSWNKADYATMPGNVHAPFAVLTQTIDQGIPLIYSGQEEPFLDSLSFFYKDTISFGKYQRSVFYKTLLNLRKNNPALAANASFKKLITSNDQSIYAFEREKEGNRVLVILNLSKMPQEFTWVSKPSANQWNNVFAKNKTLKQGGMSIDPWGYQVYEMNK